mmetsp:Transcript_92065/g.213984  ORF Transcript_92065/g.213984 Transcript_92065/m.213984 type:complete len:510 (-) Transcript_92065:44-1573(-)
MTSLKDLGYEEIKIIGRGHYGVVQLVRHLEDKMLYVCKTVDLTCRPKAEREAAAQEVGLLKRLHHPNIVQYKESFVRGDAIIILMQHCEGGDLAGHIREMAKKRMRIKEATIMSYLVQVLRALQYVHNQRILHRDLKSSNLFLTDKGATVKLGDFGISRVLETSMQAAMSVVGTPHYMSPEVCENRPYNQKSDVWSLGCVVYELCMLKHAFVAANLLGLVHKIVREKFEPIPPIYSAGLNNLVQRMLAKGANARPSVNGLLEDKFVQSFIRSQARSRSHLSPTRTADGSKSTAATGQEMSSDVGEGPATAEPPPLLEVSGEASTLGVLSTNANEAGRMGTSAALVEDSEEYEEYEDDFCSEEEDVDFEEEVEDHSLGQVSESDLEDELAEADEEVFEANFANSQEQALHDTDQEVLQELALDEGPRTAAPSRSTRLVVKDEPPRILTSRGSSTHSISPSGCAGTKAMVGHRCPSQASSVQPNGRTVAATPKCTFRKLIVQRFKLAVSHR